MNIRDAILMAADHIERSPGEFRFSTHAIPRSPGCGTPGCAIGWIQSFMERPVLLPPDPQWSMCFEGSAAAPMLVREDEFYVRMDALYVTAWRANAGQCATALRLYADKFHPATPMQHPDWRAMSAVQTIGAHEQDQFARVTP